MNFSPAIGVLLIYLLIISIAAAAVTCRDKKLAKLSGARRIPEKTLFMLAALGGAPAMYITMKKIRHKTKHKRFMAGIPLIMICHLALIFAFVYYFRSTVS